MNWLVSSGVMLNTIKALHTHTQNAKWHEKPKQFERACAMDLGLVYEYDYGKQCLRKYEPPQNVEKICALHSTQFDIYTYILIIWPGALLKL